MNILPGSNHLNSRLFAYMLAKSQDRLQAYDPGSDKPEASKPADPAMQTKTPAPAPGALSAGQVSQELLSADSAVKAHEKTHLMILGGYAQGGINYDYIMLGNGQKYAVGGSVGVDTDPVPGNPEATLRKARIIRFAALGPNNPSSADQKIAAAAYQMEMQARRELEKKDAEKNEGNIKGENVFNLEAAGINFSNEPLMNPVTPDTQPVPGDPQATIRKAQNLRREAVQGEKASRKLQIIVKSYQMEMQAQRELARKQTQGTEELPVNTYA